MSSKINQVISLPLNADTDLVQRRALIQLLSTIVDAVNTRTSEAGFLGKFSGNPSGYEEGDLWYDLTEHKLKYYNGSSIVEVS